MNRVRWAEELVGEVEDMAPESWRRFLAHDKFELFADEYLTAKCITDFWYFRHYGIYWRARGHYDAPLYGPEGTAGFLQNWTREDGTPIRVKFLVINRDACKTQETIAWDTWDFARDVNNRLLIRAFTDDKAKEICLGLRQTIESESFQHRFPWVRPARRGHGQSLLWKDDRLLLDRADISVRSPSVEACGEGKDPTGGHFHRRHGDDIEVKANAFSDVLMKKMIRTFRNDTNLMSAGSRSVICGTPWVLNGLVYPVMMHRGDFADHEYDLFVQPATVKVFSQPFSGAEPILLEDRVTVRAQGAGFPTIEGNLIGCQARVTFFSKAVRDTVTEIREIVSNDGDHFRVNRQYPRILGQPLQYSCGPDKPAAPNRNTLDSVDWIPGRNDGIAIARKSLPAAKIEQGTLDYEAQMNLNPIDPGSLIFQEDHAQIISEDQLPAEGDRIWYQAMDMADARKSKASTAITTAFHHVTGLYVMHLVYENAMKPLDILLALFLGALRVRDWGGQLRTTLHEAAHAERAILNRTEIREIEKNPFAFFEARGGRYRQAAEMHFRESGPVFLRLHELTRGGNESKTGRISSTQPFVEAKMFHVIDTCPHLEQILEEMATFTLENTATFDIWDTIADIIRDGRRPKPPQPKTDRPGNDFIRRNKQALLRLRLAGSVPRWSG